MQDNLKQLLLIIQQLSNSQAVVTYQGEYVSTPNVIVHTRLDRETGELTTVRIGKGYLPQNKTVYIGITVTKQQSQVTRVYNVDRSKIPSGYQFTWTDKDGKVIMKNEGDVKEQ